MEFPSYLNLTCFEMFHSSVTFIEFNCTKVKELVLIDLT
jgi:hypothetical protein